MAANSKATHEHLAQGNSVLASLCQQEVETEGAGTGHQHDVDNAEATASSDERTDTAHDSYSFQQPPPVPVSIPSSSRGLVWFENGPRLQFQQAIDAGVWHTPVTEIELLRYKVFCALWEQGYYVGPGSKFGGDFVLYPGDMLRYHSQFVVSVVPVDKMYSPLDAIMFGRLGTVVKKSHAMCSWDEKKDKMLCYCIQWTSWN
ncbi:tRNA-splicing endonuclease subunit [Geranomyces michiganensis]|nr:tRNA-splicing endonuclease subunit [Geranomyces michiganensis]